MGNDGEVKIRISTDTKGTAEDLKKVESGLDGIGSSAARAGTSLNSAKPALDNIGMSAKATSAALRGVPAQFTDIVTSLQGGQSPLTVLMQQGGQLKDMFGGVGPAAKALGGYVLGLVNPFTLAAGAAAALAYAYVKGAEESSAFARSLILSGNAAGTSAGQLMDKTASVAASTGATRGAVAESMNVLAASGKVSAEIIDKVTQSAINLERVGGKAATETAAEFIALGSDPVKAVLKLDEKYRFLTAAVYEQIKALADEGREVDAAKLAQTAYHDAIESRIPTLSANLGILEKAWRSVWDAAKGYGNVVLSIGREQSLDERLRKAQAGMIGEYDYSARATIKVPGSQAKVDSLSNEIEARDQALLIQQKSRMSEEAKIKWMNQADQYLDKETKKRKELAAIEREGLAAGAAREEIEKRLAVVREKYADKSPTPRKARQETIKLDPTIERLRLEARAADAGLAPETVKELDAIFADANMTLAERNRLIDVAIGNDRVLAAEQAKVAATAKEVAQATALINDYRANNQSLMERIDRESALALLGEKQRLIAEALYKADDDAAKMRERIIHDIADEEARTRALAEVTSELADQKARVAEATAANYEAQRTFEFGWQKAYRAYEEDATNAAKTAEKAFADSTGAMESMIRNFVKTGKLDWKSFADSMIDTLLTMNMQALKVDVFQPLMSGAKDWFSGLFNSGASGTGAGTAILGSLFGAPGRASGGPVSAGGLYEVNERGRPELLSVAGRQYLMMGKQNGLVSNTANNQEDRSLHLTVNVNSASGDAAEIRRSSGYLGRQLLSAISGARRYG